MTPSPGRGFTLIELMVVATVAALLAAVALPSYQHQVAKGRRADARQALMALGHQLERYRAERGTYVGAAVGALGVYPATSPGGYYALAITAQDGDGFSLSASPTGAQAGDACGRFSYNALGEAGVSGGSLSLAQCW